MPNPTRDDPAAFIDAEDRFWWNLRRQLKFVVLGGLLVWYFQTTLHWSEVLRSRELIEPDVVTATGTLQRGKKWFEGRWSSGGVASPFESTTTTTTTTATIASSRIPQFLAIASLALLALTVALFGILMLLPLRGRPTNFSTWQHDSHLRRLIPLLTVSLVAGFTTLVITLSPLCALPPPSSSLASRLASASLAAGANLHSTSQSLQSLLHDLSTSLGFPSSTSSTSSPLALPSQIQHYLASLHSSDLLTRLRLTSPSNLATKFNLDLTPTQADEFLRILDSYQARARLWIEGNVRSMGWIGAVGGTVGVYLTVLGTVGIAALFVKAVQGNSASTATLAPTPSTLTSIATRKDQ